MEGVAWWDGVCPYLSVKSTPVDSQVWISQRVVAMTAGFVFSRPSIPSILTVRAYNTLACVTFQKQSPVCKCTHSTNTSTFLREIEHSYSWNYNTKMQW